MTDASREMSLGQFVKQLVALFGSKNETLPFKDQKRWHLLFYELTKFPATPGKPKFLDELVFDWDVPYPKCQELSDFLHALHWTASVSANNPRFDVIRIEPAVADRWSEQFDQVDPDSQKFLREAEELARKEFAAPAVD